ncbi:hypothetical protein Vadar_016953 [Vaccinium darrowii]|uniref:Uncharacterized protein n=1 Tax=Vaccinium darrowii TaxID=229202 RepID=A0ACB7XZV6_9ERIC|nr:hypothetical protein Vadar_016953 [Vaccinium darrowii]
MKPEKEPSSSRLGYIPVETTNLDSTTNKSTIKIPTTNSATAITIEAPPFEPPTIVQTQRPLPPPPPHARNQEEDIYCNIQGLLILLDFLFLVCLLIMRASAVDRYSPEIYIHAVSFSLHNISSAHVTTKGEITFNVTKPLDCAVLMYGDIAVSIFYEKEHLSTTIMEPFTQMEMNHTMTKALFPSKISPIETWVAKKIAWNFISSSSFEFPFDVKATGGLWPNNGTVPQDKKTERFLTILCPNVKVEIVTKTGVGTMIGEPLKCKVETETF